jgi:glutathione peroxidase-family protein
VPFVVTFATPKFCSSRTCGPVVDVVEEVQHRLEGEDVRFIHVEVYEDNDPALGYNEWMGEWKLRTEPWTFLVGSNGMIVDRFEGTVSVNELETAVREKLLAAQ